MSTIEDHNDTARRLAHQLISAPPEAGRLFGRPDTDYGTLYARATSLRRRLDDTRPASPAPPHPVCLCTADRTVAAAALLATLAGGPPLLLPHAYSRRVLADLQQLTQFETAIVDQTYPLPKGTRTVEFDSLPSTGMDLQFTSALAPEAPWVQLFTGGSTGTPRLWTKTVGNLLSEADYLQKAFGVSTGDRVLTTSPPFHIYGLLYAVLVPLLAKAAVLEVTPTFPGELAAAIRDQAPTILVTVPAYYRALKNHLPDSHHLRMAFSSASPLADTDADNFTAATGVPIYDVYGSTETGGIASRCRAAGKGGFAPFDCVDIRVEHERLKVRSRFLSPQLKFDRQGFFEAADRVAAGRDGTFTVIGRADGVIKVGGRRVDLADIRNRILQLEGVRDALVFARPVATGRGNEILALVETDLPGDNIRRHLSQALEPWAHPRAIRVISRMPVTASGKYDRQTIGHLF